MVDECLIFGQRQLNWIMGCNPFDSCMIEGYGKNNIRYFFNDQYDFMYGVCNGKLLQICFSNDESVNAWSVIKTKGEFKDACSITRPDGNFDLFVKVKREINGL